MKNWICRLAWKAGMALLVVTTTGMPAGSASEYSVWSKPERVEGKRTASGEAAQRERALLDFGWRFHFGHANEAAKDFGFGGGGFGGGGAGGVVEDGKADGSSISFRVGNTTYTE